MEEKSLNVVPRKSFGLPCSVFRLVTSILSLFVFRKGEQTSCDKSLFMLVVLFCTGVIIYQTYRLLSLDKEYLRCTVEGFTTNQTQKKPSHFYAWARCRGIFLLSVGGKYRIPIGLKFILKQGKCEIPILSSSVEEEGFSLFIQSADLIIPIILLDVDFPERVYEIMKYYEREWRIEQNRQARKRGKQASKTNLPNRHSLSLLKVE